MRNRFQLSVTLPMVALLALAGSQDTVTPVADGRVAAESPGPADFQIEVSGRVWVTGGSTIRSWECEAERLEIRVRISGDPDRLEIADLGDAVSLVELHAATPAMDCDNDTMNNHMWEALNAREHGWISFRMSDYELESAGNSDSGVRISGTLAMAGETHDVVLDATLEQQADGTLALEGSHELNMTDWGISPPRLMLGTLRVDEVVQVHWDLTMRATD